MQQDEQFQQFLASIFGGEGLRLPRHNHEEKLGEKLCDLTAKEIADFELGQSQAKALQQSKQDLQDRIQESNAENEKWWRDVRKAHTLRNVPHLHLDLEKAAIYEVLDKQN